MDTEFVGMEVALWCGLCPFGSTSMSSPPNLVPGESGRGYTAFASTLHRSSSRSGQRRHLWWWCLDPFLPCESPSPPGVAQVSYEAEKLLRLTPSIKLSTDLLIFKCLLSAVKFCIFCKPFSPNSRRLKSYIWFFYIPLFSTKCGFYLE